MNIHNRQKFEIELLSRNYIDSKRKLKDHEQKTVRYSVDRVRLYRRIVTHIEDVIAILPEKERIIIENEVIKGRSGAWYLEYFSAPSYYRHRSKAYDNFLRCL